jgi:hypothetical protein
LSRAQPSPQEERWLVLAMRYSELRAAIEADGRCAGWKTSSWLSRCLFFLLGVAAAGTLSGALLIVPSGARLVVAGVALVTVAEYLIGKRRVVRSGIEEALFVCGCCALALQLGQWVDANTRTVALLLAVAFGCAGLRLLNPLLTSVAALLCSVAIALPDRALPACLFCAAVGLAVLAADSADFRRPAHARMIEGLILAMPLAASLWLLVDDARFAVFPPLVFGGLCFVLGMQRRSHALLFAGLVQVPCLGWALYAFVPVALHWQLIVWGAMTFSATLVVERVLREPRNGLGSRLRYLESAGAASLARGTQPAPPPGMYSGQGGSFGGGGSSGTF